MKVWITGAGGMMGSHLAEMLLAAGHDVYATYCRPTIDPSDLQFNGAEVDITDWCSVYDSIATFRPTRYFISRPKAIRRFRGPGRLRR